MDFNFSNLKQTSFSSTGGQYLKPYDIYEVNLTKIEKTEIKGSKDPNKVYPVISLEFTETGDSKKTFTTNLFIPSTKEDLERPTFQNSNGHDYQRPSRFENFQFTLMQIVHALNPEAEEKIKNNGDKIKTIDQFIDLILKALKDKNKIKTNLKLVGKTNNNVVYAALPNACGLNKEGELFPTNFIGKDLFFSDYELTKQREYKNAKPTAMKDESPNDDNSGDDYDLEDLDL